MNNSRTVYDDIGDSYVVTYSLSTKRMTHLSDCYLFISLCMWYLKVYYNVTNHRPRPHPHPLTDLSSSLESTT